MRVVFLNTSSVESPYTGGRCLPFARALAAQGHDVHIVTLHHDMPSPRPFTLYQEQVHIHYVGQMHVWKRDNLTTYFGVRTLTHVVLKATLRMIRYALALKADIYHIGKPHPQNSIAGFVAKVAQHVPIVLDYDDLEHVSNVFQASWQRIVARWLETWIPRLVDGVTYHATVLGDYLTALGVPKQRCLRLLSIVERERFMHVSRDAIVAWRQRLALPSDTSIIIYVGSMALVNHPVDLLLKAFALLMERNVKAHLLLVGGGPDFERLQKMARGLGIHTRCTFTGRVPPTEVPALLHIARLSVDPVRNDLVAKARWPLKIVESLAAGVPVVTGDVGDRREMLADGRAGILVAPDNPKALADGLEKGLRDATCWKAMHEAASDALVRFNEVSSVEKLLVFYESLV